MPTGMKKMALDNLLFQADNWLGHEPRPPVILRVPDYYSNKDGNRAATEPLDWDSRAALSAALAWRVTGQERYAAQAAKVLTAWATTLKQVKGFDSQLALIHMGLSFLESWRLLNGYPWEGDQFLTLVNSLYLPAAAALISHANNPGAWGWCGLVAATRCNGTVGSELVDGFLKHLKNAVNLKTGDLPLEDRRTNSGLWYTSWALEAYTKGLLIIRQSLGADYVPLLRPAYKRLSEFVLNPGTWPHRLPSSGPFWRIRRAVIKAMYPCADKLEIPESGRWPSGLLDTLILRGEFYPPWLQPNINDWLEQARPIGEGDCFRFSTLKYYWGLEP